MKPLTDVILKAVHFINLLSAVQVCNSYICPVVYFSNQLVGDLPIEDGTQRS